MRALNMVERRAGVRTLDGPGLEIDMMAEVGMNSLGLQVGYGVFRVSDSQFRCPEL
jgi:hypothetical protein